MSMEANITHLHRRTYCNLWDQSYSSLVGIPEKKKDCVIAPFYSRSGSSLDTFVRSVTPNLIEKINLRPELGWKMLRTGAD